MVQIRQAVPDDAKEFLSFLLTLDQETSFMLYEPGERTTGEAELKQKIEKTREHSLLLVAEGGEKIVGFLSASRGNVNRIKHSAYVVVGILNNYRGMGVGGRLFEELDTWAVNHGVSRLELTVMTKNEQAIKLYKKMGYKVEGIKEKSCFVNGEFVDEYYMAKTEFSRENTRKVIKNMVLNHLQVYQRSQHFIWTDKYISKNMLAAHLDLNSDAASRNTTTIKRTIEWIEARIPKGGKILDLGCGPGLYTSLLSKKGYSVTGIDISKSSIAYAQKKAAQENLPIHYFCKDYLNSEIGEGYDAILCIYCDFGALIPSEQEILLKKIYHSLKDGGVFIFDVFKSGLCNNKQEKRDWHYSDGGDFWCGSPHLVLEEEKHFTEHNVWGTRTIIIEENKQPREYITWDHYYSKSDIEILLNKNGLKVISFKDELIAENEFVSNDVMFIEAKK
ncbi:Acetyltransferase (GNAT) family protein [Evansella caseinilytica]|uniref:Acetyltransferase (GNAT) family protein n=1 Tax=Evansella caseinilytica TaxID=1503961 RepID=A0A1H3NUP4_9BACI|nr:bifunctional GNAT family N-acetyltransferase/class I SAM-dependent methyltransferase [Evansella caseinilytica]SDY92671.1 Acetyltransferase (GNAT) family protein [Evansella caseinilytica]